MVKATEDGKGDHLTATEGGGRRSGWHELSDALVAPETARPPAAAA